MLPEHLKQKIVANAQKGSPFLQALEDLVGAPDLYAEAERYFADEYRAAVDHLKAAHGGKWPKGFNAYETANNARWAAHVRAAFQLGMLASDLDRVLFDDWAEEAAEAAPAGLAAEARIEHLENLLRLAGRYVEAAGFTTTAYDGGPFIDRNQLAAQIRAALESADERARQGPAPAPGADADKAADPIDDELMFEAQLHAAWPKLNTESRKALRDKVRALAAATAGQAERGD